MALYRRPMFWILVFVAAIGIMFSSIYLVVNLLVIPTELSKAFDDSHKSAGQDTKVAGTDDKTSNVSFWQLGWVQRFEAISLDLSAVTPFVMFWYFLSILYYSLKYRARLSTKSSYFIPTLALPFPELFGNTCIQLGFIGTLWGFLLIGWKMKSVMMSSASGEVLDILLKAFGTALLSTFTAVVVVYIFVPPVQWLWRWIMNFGEYEETDISEAVKNLTKEFKESASALATLQKEMNALHSEVQKLQPEAIVAGLKGIKVALDEAGKMFANFPSALQKQLTDIVKNPICERLDTAVKGIELQSGLVKEMSGEIKKAGEFASKSNELLGQVIKSTVEGSRNISDKADKALNSLSTANTSLANIHTIALDVKTKTAEIHKEISDFSTKTERGLKSLENETKSAVRAVDTSIKSESKGILDKLSGLTDWMQGLPDSKVSPKPSEEGSPHHREPAEKPAAPKWWRWPWF